MRRLINLPEETWWELRGEAAKRNIKMGELFAQMADDVLHPKVSALEASHFHPGNAIFTPDVWTTIPGKMPTEHKVVPGQAPRSTTVPNSGPHVVTGPGGGKNVFRDIPIDSSFGKSRAAPKPGNSPRKK